jgi:hypothetical protein
VGIGRRHERINRQLVGIAEASCREGGGVIVLRSMRAGFQRTLGAPGMMLALWLVNLAVALPAGWMMASALEESIGASQVHRELRDGFDMGWFGEFAAEARGIEATFRPSIAGATAFYDNLEAWLTGDLFSGFAGIVGVGILYALLWMLLLGGVLQRFARRDRRGFAAFVSDGGAFCPRFLRLALLSAPLYWLVYRVYRLLYERLEEATRDVTAEATVLLMSLGVWVLTALLLTLIHVSFDYAKIATVVDERRSMLLAALRGAGFVLRHPLRTCGLFYGMVLIGLLLLALWAWIGPGIAQSTWSGVVLAFAVGQLYLLARLTLRVALLGAEVDLYRRLG